MVAEAGLERALGLAGIALNDNGAPVFVDEATAPPDTRTVVPDATALPSAPDRPTTSASDEGSEQQTLEEFAAELVGATEPEVSTTPATPAEAPATEPAVPLTPREVELQAELDKYRAEAAQAELQGKVGERQQQYNERWNEGQDYWERVVPAQVRAEAQRQGLSELDVTKAEVIIAQKHRQWNETFLVNERDDPLLKPETYAQPALVDQLITQYGLTPDDKPALQKYATNPELMKDVAATIGARVAAVANRTQAAQTQARDQVAQHLSNGISPGAPAVSTGKAPYKMRGGEHDYQEALAFSQALQRGLLGPRR